jgi:hypothetical protein
MNVFESVRDSGQRAGMMVVDQRLLTDLDRPYLFHRNLDSILSKDKKIGCFNLGCRVCVRNADSKGVVLRGTQVLVVDSNSKGIQAGKTTLDPRR